MNRKEKGERLAQFRAVYSREKTCRQMAAEIGENCSHDYIRATCYRQGLDFKARTAWRREIIENAVRRLEAIARFKNSPGKIEQAGDILSEAMAELGSSKISEAYRKAMR